MSSDSYNKKSKISGLEEKLLESGINQEILDSIKENTNAANYIAIIRSIYNKNKKIEKNYEASGNKYQIKSN